MARRFLPVVILGFIVVIASGWSGSAWAEESLFDRLGGMPGVTRIVNGAVELFYVDPRIKADFEETDPGWLKTRLTMQICQMVGGPCIYPGRNMAASHAALHIDRVRFNAVAEDLQQAMETEGVPYWTQNRLIALLAPMQRDIVTR